MQAREISRPFIIFLDQLPEKSAWVKLKEYPFQDLDNPSLWLAAWQSVKSSGRCSKGEWEGGGGGGLKKIFFGPLGLILV